MGTRLRSRPRVTRPPLTREQRKLVRDHVELARNLAWKHFKKNRHKFKSNDAIDDLISEAFLQLAMAAGRFDPSKGYKFITYAYSTISLGLMDCHGEKFSPIRMNKQLLTKRNKVRKLLLDEGLTHEQVAEKLGLKLSEVTVCEESYSLNFMSMEASLFDSPEGKAPLADAIPDLKRISRYEEDFTEAQRKFVEGLSDMDLRRACVAAGISEAESKRSCTGKIVRGHGNKIIEKIKKVSGETDK